MVSYLEFIFIKGSDPGQFLRRVDLNKIPHLLYVFGQTDHDCANCIDLDQTLQNAITKTCLYNVDPLKPHFYIVKLGFTGVYIIFLISAQKHRLWVPVRSASSSYNLCSEQKHEKYQTFFYLKIFIFWR